MVSNQLDQGARVRNARAAIEAGTYLTPERIAVAAKRALISIGIDADAHPILTADCDDYGTTGDDTTNSTGTRA